VVADSRGENGGNGTGGDGDGGGGGSGEAGGAGGGAVSTTQRSVQPAWLAVSPTEYSPTETGTGAPAACGAPFGHIVL
jgi:hypothetical protein